MKNVQVVIKCDLGYLSGYFERKYEWTKDKSTAWRMNISVAKTRLDLVKEHEPNAKIYRLNGKEL